MIEWSPYKIDCVFILKGPMTVNDEHCCVDLRLKSYHSFEKYQNNCEDGYLLFHDCSICRKKNE